MKHYYILILLAAALGFSGCESENPTSNSSDTKKELEVLPSIITIERFTEFTIKARMTNTPLSDVYMHYDFGDGRGAMDVAAGNNAFHFYLDTGSFTITVTAYDGFNDSLLATKIIPARILELPRSVTFPYESIDTTLECDVNGNLPNMYLSVNTTAPYPTFIWDFGDGTSDTTKNYYLVHNYQKSGNYTVTVSVYDNNNTYWGSDTMNIRISHPTVTRSMLEDTKKVTVVYSPDSTSSIFTELKKSYSRLESAIIFDGDSTTSSWNNNTFDLHYKQYFPNAPESIRMDYHINGRLSNDLKTLEEVTVSMIDTIPGITLANRHGYKLFNIELAGVNNMYIIYKVRHKALSQFVSNEYYSKNFLGYRPFGYTDYLMLYSLIDFNKPNPPYTYVIFTR